MLGPGRALVDIGPVHLVVQAWLRGEPCSEAAVAGAERAVGLLEELSRHLDTARLPVGHPDCRQGNPSPRC